MRKNRVVGHNSLCPFARSLRLPPPSHAIPKWISCFLCNDFCTKISLLSLPFLILFVNIYPVVNQIYIYFSIIPFLTTDLIKEQVTIFRFNG